MIPKLYILYRIVKIISDANAIDDCQSHAKIEDLPSKMKRRMLRARARRYAIKKELPRISVAR